ncbi:hypothetical protein PYCC9005_003532 [Savitreella phatthalungensis]
MYSTSMRDNYAAGGVANYYRDVGSTYRNPSFGAVRVALTNVLSAFAEREKFAFRLRLLDFACGAGEVTSVVEEWHRIGLTLPEQVNDNFNPAPARQRVGTARARFVATHEIELELFAADPFTRDAFVRAHPEVPFAELSFDQCDALDQLIGPGGTADITVISYALHLLSDESRLYACLSALARASTWLLILSPHKKPAIRQAGAPYGWRQIDLPGSMASRCWLYADETYPARENDGEVGEAVIERCHARLYRSQEMYNYET